MVNASKFVLQAECPQCGAPVELEEAVRVFSCAYCGVKHVIHFYPQPVLVVGARALKDTVYVPFWRLRGIYFAVTTRGVEHFHVDSSLCALSGAESLSLGLRPQLVKLRFVHQEEGIFLRPSFGRRRFLEKLSSIVRGVALETRSIFYETFMGEWISLLYTPWEEKGATKEVLPIERLRLDFWPALCPHCGGDLAVSSRAQVFFCPQCESTWEIGSRGFRRAPHRLLGTKGEVWLPFWRLMVEVKGPVVNFLHKPPLSTLAIPPKAVFLLPAFKVKPRLFLRLAQQMSLSACPKEALPDPRRQFILPTLPAVEAFQGIPPLLAEMIPRSKQEEFFPLLAKTRFAFQGKELWWLSLREQAYDYVFPETGLAIPKKAVALGENL